MKFLKLMKDGGPLSRVTGFFIVEMKSLFSVVVLHFAPGSREAYHTHAFNAVSWVLRGKLLEHDIGGSSRVYARSFKPVFTSRSKFHKVESIGHTWAITFRGPWVDRWLEWIPAEHRKLMLTHGRRVV